MVAVQPGRSWPQHVLTEHENVVMRIDVVACYYIPPVNTRSRLPSHCFRMKRVSEVNRALHLESKNVFFCYSQFKEATTTRGFGWPFSNNPSLLLIAEVDIVRAPCADRFPIIINVVLPVAKSCMVLSAIILILPPNFCQIATKLGINPLHLGTVNSEYVDLSGEAAGGLKLFVT